MTRLQLMIMAATGAAGLVLAILLKVEFAWTGGNAFSAPTVETHCGPVAGDISNGVYTFKGIPYAVPPKRERRWKAPEGLSRENGTCWRGTYKAKQFGSMCPQHLPTDQSYAGDEDCLYVNIFTPTLNPKANLPVLVWIHGGYLLFANGNWPKYGPDEDTSAKLKEFVFVTFNYRLNIFGFLALDLLSGASPTKHSGNYGFMDQILVLKWVQRNIKAFGGNPDLVTIYGQSSGGTSVFALMLSPLADGLFHRAWSISGSPIINKDLATVSKDNLKILEATGCTTLRCLQQLDPKKLVQAMEVLWNYVEEMSDLPTKGNFDASLIFADGTVIPDLNFKWKDVPFMIGTTAQEIDMGPVPAEVRTWSKQQYNAYVKTKLDTFGKAISAKALELYPTSNSSDPEYLYTSMVSDMRVNCPNDVLANQAQSSDRTTGVYRYVITEFPSVPTIAFKGFTFKAKYAFHNFDNMAFSGHIPNFIESPTAKDIQFQQTMMENIISFVQIGYPKASNWKPCPMGTALLGAKVNFSSGAHGYAPNKCKFWMENHFYDYAWIN
ncbi:unnamed protein product [Owenia fusiformis]|uniref:Carboxylic ester hydrolase n=1 Tax=Owenia fusiformis TaxID=6347 RepID=A0A8S4Q909_OWEFU|nr:unnamed protein product [Owenia fusiformis]